MKTLRIVKNLKEERDSLNRALENLCDELTDINDHTGCELVRAIVEGQNPQKVKALFAQWYKRETQGYL